ncbi:hypothetical protein J1N35_038652 [Gossypium stocksii]|uniref:Uncharacterized protein n=1 Tax=Gossypium stocksii TaxID=47602 RepID=A0A9D3ZMU1_9ROSI|nr:hypothetical protein J1N35_038652 [Gossypium stocksii]
MLAKQGWRLINYPDSLLSRTLKAKYDNDSNFMESRTAVSFRSVTFSHNLSNITDLSPLPDHILIELFLRTLKAGKLTERVLKLFIAIGKDEVFSLVQALNIQVTVTPLLPTTLIVVAL